MQIIWTDYFRYRVKLRGFNLNDLEEILRYSTERYYDTATDRLVVIGRDAKTMIMTPYERDNSDVVTPITVQATNRQQVNYRVEAEDFRNEKTQNCLL
jgi:hypothetical protein